jgi:hypothetical protein
MAHGVIESISMSTFVESVLSLELPYIHMLFFPISLICLFFYNFCFFIFASPLYKVSSH